MTKDIGYIVRSKEESEKVQNALFEKGLVWSGGMESELYFPTSTHPPYVIFARGEIITWDNMENAKAQSTARLVEADSLLNPARHITAEQMFNELVEAGEIAEKVDFPVGMWIGWKVDDIEYPPPVLEEIIPIPQETVNGINLPSNTGEKNMTTYKQIVQNLTTPVPDTNPKRQYGMRSIPLNLWSPLASAYGAVGLYNGSLKYGQGNYKATPVEASIYIAAMLRHAVAWAEGQEYDPADGVPNLAGVLANVAIILDARANGTLIDDRQIPSGYLDEIEKLKDIVVSLQKLHEGKTPRHYTIANKKVK